jgi:hypothetical protein
MLDKLIKALEGKEIDFDVKALQADLDTLKQGYATEIEDNKLKSQKIGQEILLKELKNDLGFDYEGRKDPENLKKAYIDKFGTPPAAANVDLDALQNSFTKQLEAKESEIESIKNTYKKESDNKTISEALKSSFSAFDGKTNYKTEDLVTIALSKNEFAVVDGKVFKSKDGEVIKNDVYQTVTSDAFANTMMLDGYIKKAEGGRVIGDETKGGKYSMDEFISSQEAQGVNVNSQEFAVNMDKAVASGTIEL